jgi:hypothetical protein
MLPQRRKPMKSGIDRADRREWPKHRAFVRRHTCSVPGCDQGPIEFAHVRSADNSGTSLKPHDAYGVSLCAAHHAEQHQHGAETFMKRHRVDLWKLAVEFCKASPDINMKQSMAIS